MTDVARYEPRSGELTWPRSAAERAVARDGRLVQQIITEKTLASLRAAELDRTLALMTRSAIKATHAAMTADTAQITDPHTRLVMEKVDRELMEYHHQHQVGYYRLAGEAFAQQLLRDITPATSPPPDTVWQRLALEITGG